MMDLKDFGKRLEQIENEFIRAWNSDVPDWMVRDANVKRNREVGKLLKMIKENSSNLKFCPKCKEEMRWCIDGDAEFWHCSNCLHEIPILKK